MKKLLVFLSVLITCNSFSQNSARFQIYGKVIVESADVSGITVYNKSLSQGAITDVKGEFNLEVRLHDSIEVSAIQYKNISFKVNDDMIESKSVKVFLIEEINELDEVVLFSKKLTGNLSLDIKEKVPFKPKLDVLYFGIKDKNEFDTHNLTKVNSAAMDAQQLPSMINGLNIVNIVDQLLLPLFRSEVRNKEKVGVPDVPIQSIKYYLGSEFLVDNFDIPAHRVEEFIVYVESNNFDFNLLNYGREMEFIQVLSERSLMFLN